MGLAFAGGAVEADEGGCCDDVFELRLGEVDKVPLDRVVEEVMGAAPLGVSVPTEELLLAAAWLMDWLEFDLRVEPTNLRNRLFMPDM